MIGESMYCGCGKFSPRDVTITGDHRNMMCVCRYCGLLPPKAQGADLCSEARQLMKLMDSELIPRKGCSGAVYTLAGRYRRAVTDYAVASKREGELQILQSIDAYIRSMLNEVSE